MEIGAVLAADELVSNNITISISRPPICLRPQLNGKKNNIEKHATWPSFFPYLFGQTINEGHSDEYS